MAASYLITALMIAILETSISFDNAVVNARVLRTISPVWRKLFMTLGIAVSVFGMRILFPLLIVAVAGDTHVLDAFVIITREPLRYQQIMHDSHLMLMGFGATFLLMVVAEYFINQERREHWLPIIEPMLARLGSIENAQSMIGLLLITLVATAIPANQKVEFLSSCFCGYVVFMTLHVLKYKLLGDMNMQRVGAKNGLISFVYLEILDASFSMDGVIAVFAITNDFWLIASGLGIGAVFVRSMTILLVERNIIGQFKYLETAAFWAIFTLVASMFASALHVDLGSALSGLISLAIISLGIITSLPRRRRYRS